MEFGLSRRRSTEASALGRYGWIWRSCEMAASTARDRMITRTRPSFALAEAGHAEAVTHELDRTTLFGGRGVTLPRPPAVFLTGKGDAMSGGGVRTTYKGKTGFEDFISRLTFIIGIPFLALMLLLDVVGNRLLQ